MNIEDEELDNFFKSKVHHDASEPDFDASAWNAIEKRLNKRDRKIMLFNISFSIMLLCLLGFGLNLYLNQASGIKKATFLAKHKKGAINPLVLKPGKEPIENSIKVSPNTKVEPKKKIIPELANSNAEMNDRTTKPVREQKFSTTENTYPDTSIIQDESTFAYSPSVNLTDSLENNAQKIASANQTEQVASADKEQKKKSPKKTNLGFSFSSGPEFNTAGSINNAQTNLNIGLAFFAVRSKVKLSIGANYGLKSYNANVSQYNNIRPAIKNLVNNISANCNVLEVPMLVSYPIRTCKKNVISLSAGLSSYFMLKENYTYQYDPSSGYKDYSFTVENRNQHYFKVVQFSADYSLPIKNAGSSLGLEPYIKLPLQGVGVGQVLLKSYGLNLKYTYGLSKK